MSLGPCLSPAVAATITTFSDGSSSKTVFIPVGGGTDTSVSLSIAKNSYPTAATLTVRGGPDGAGRYPLAPAVYMVSTSNSTQVYGFSGTGYGEMGRQVVFSNGSTVAPVQFSGAGSDSTPTLLLPTGAGVFGGDLTVTGETVDLGFTGPETVNTKVGQNNLQIDTAQRGSPYLVDIDADGDLDMFAAGGNFSSFNEPYAGGPRFYRNNGTATAWLFQEEPLVVRRVQMGYGFSPALADLDNDGDFDLLTVGGYYNALVRFYWNSGSSTAPNWTQNNSVFSGLTVDAFSHAAFADLDSDGDQDLTIGSDGGALIYYRNTGTPTAPAWTTANIFSGINVGNSAAPSFGDYDFDGDLDLFIGNGTASWTNFGEGTEVIKYFENRGNATAPSFAAGSVTDGMNVGGTYTGTNLAPFAADMDDDGDLDLIVADYEGRYWVYLGSRSDPANVALDVGADGSTDWTYSGTLKGAVSASGLASAFQSALSLGNPPADAWGNRMLPIHVKVTSAAAGRVVLSGLSVTYNYTQISRDFATTLNRVREGSNPDASGNVAVTVPVYAATAGAVTLGGLQVQVNLPPTVVAPPVLHMNEDTRVDNLIDLTTVFVDDLAFGPALNFTVFANSNPQQVDVYISPGGRFLGADAANSLAGDNWFGTLTVSVEARDNYNLGATATFTIVVDPVNDFPVISGVGGSFNISEDQGWELVPNGGDVDNDPLTWTINGLPSTAQFDPSSGRISWTAKQADVGTHPMSLYLSDSHETVQVNFVVTVVNVNDAPYLLPIPDQVAKEAVPLTLDLSPFYGDEDDTALIVSAVSEHTSGTTVLTIFFPKGSGVGAERVRVTVFDPSGLSASGVFVVTVIPTGPDLALVGVPDQQVVEGSAKTLDIAPYLYNVENWANVTLTTGSTHVGASGTKLTFLYPVGYPGDSETVKIQAQEGTETAAWSIAVTIIRLGQAILIADLPDVDIAADEEMVLDLAPYIHNVVSWSAVVISEDSPYAQVEGTMLRLLYPASASVTGETVTITVAQPGETSADAMVVRVRSVGRSFYLDPIPALNVVEGQPYVLFLSSYIHNADPLTNVEVFLSSTHTTVEGLRVEFLYAVGGGIQGEQVALLARFGTQTFQTVISVSVASLGEDFALAGVPNLAVYAGTPYTISLEPYLYNVPGGDFEAVVITVDSAFVTVLDGLQLRLLYPPSANLSHEALTITARAGNEQSAQTITVTIRPLGTRLTLAPVPDLRVTEDLPFSFDLAPYILNARGEVTVIAESAFVTVKDGTMLRFAYPGGMTADEVVITIQSVSQGQSAQGTIRVTVAQQNDAPFSTGSPTNFSVAPGTVLSWDLAALFGDEENAAGLSFQASDSRVVIDAALRRATFTVPAAGEYSFSFTAVDAEDNALVATSPPVKVFGVVGGGGTGNNAAASGTGDVAFPLLALLLAVAAALGVRRLGGAIFGAGSKGPTLSKRP